MRVQKITDAAVGSNLKIMQVCRALNDRTSVSKGVGMSN